MKVEKKKDALGKNNQIAATPEQLAEHLARFWGHLSKGEDVACRC